MEIRQRSHVLANLNDLVRHTTCHALFTAFLQSQNMLSEGDINQLNSIDNRLKKSLTFYRLIVHLDDFYNPLCEALKETKQSGALEILEQIKPIRFDVRQPVHLFTGREAELVKLHESLTMTQGENLATLITHTASVTGLGGIGKTELCRKYIQKYSKEYDENVIWIGAERPENMENSFKIFAKDYLNISLKDVDGGDKEIKTVVDQVYNYFHDKKCIFVFDNAVNSETDKEILETFLPVRVSKRPHLLITSRDRDWELPMNIIELEELKEHEAIEFVKNGLSIHDNSQDETITALVTKLQRFPLALQQAISFISQQRSSKTFEIGEYLKAFEEESKVLLDQKISPFLSNKYAKTTLTTWKITTDVIASDEDSGNQAICMLNMMSYFYPDNIPTDLLTNWETFDEDEVHSALQLLVKYSMVSCQPTESMFFIHRMVQEVTKIELRKDSKEENILQKCFHLFGSGEKIPKNAVSHAISVFEFSHKYELLVKEFGYIVPGIAKTLIESSRWNEAKTFGAKSGEVLRQNGPSNQMNLANTENMLGSVELKFQNYEKSINHFNSVLKILENQDPSDGNRIIGSMMTKHHIQRIKEEQKASIGSSSAPKISEELDAVLHHMCNVKFEELRYKPEMQIYLETIATKCFEMGNYKQALLYRQALLDTKIDQVGSDDVEVIPKLMIGVANMNRWNDDLAAALNVSKKAYEKVEHLFEVDVEKTIIGYEFADILYHIDINEAIKVGTRVYKQREKVLGPIHVDTLASQLQVGRFLSEVGKHEEAIQTLQNCCSILEEQFGEEHDLTLDAKTWLATAFLDTKCYAEALKTYGDILKIYLESKGSSHWKTVTITSQIACTLMAMKDYENSLRLYKQVENNIVETCGVEDSRLVGIRKSIEFVEERLKVGTTQLPQRKRTCCCIM